MKKVMMVAVACVILAGCGGVGQLEASLTGYSESCVDGVAYLQFASGVTVKYNPDGTVATCN